MVGAEEEVGWVVVVTVTWDDGEEVESDDVCEDDEWEGEFR